MPADNPDDFSEDYTLSPRYRLLSPCHRAPEAVIIGRGNIDALAEKDAAWRKGPGEYDVRPSWDKHTIKMAPSPSAFRSTALVPEGASVDTYAPRPKVPPKDVIDLSASQLIGSGRSQKGGVVKGYSLSPRLERSPRNSSPGPGSYEFNSTFGSRSPPTKGKCTFGGRRPSPRATPSASDSGDLPPVSPRLRALRILEEANVARQRSAGKGFSMGAKWKDAPTPVGPNASSYRIPGIFDGPPKGVTMKGRLKHPMDDRLASHDCAKTSAPHDPDRRLKAKVKA